MTAGTVLLALAPLLAEAAAAVAARPPRSAFQSVTIVANTSGEAARRRLDFEADGRLVATNATLRQLAELAYRRHAFDPRKVSGGPSWLDTDRFDVTAKAPADHVFDADGYPRQTALMLQNMLADRFGLRVRHESSEAAGYALVVARNDGRLGPALNRSAVDCAAFMARMIEGERPAGGPQCGFGPYPRRLVGRAVTMPDLAGYLSMLLKRPVLDRTKLAGNFDLEVEGIEVVPPGPSGPSTRPSDTKRSIVEMLPEQLGLRLEEAKVSVETVVIEHARKPRLD